MQISLGKIEIDKKLIFAISPQSPIGKLLLGKIEGEVIDFNGKQQTILQVN